MPKQLDVIDDRTAEILRTKSEEERAAIAFGMWAFSLDLIRGMPAKVCPDWTRLEIDR